MKAAITDGKGNVKLSEIAEPQSGPHQCLCRIEACATCTGTDQKLVNGKFSWADTYPAILGHESFGTVVECGAKVRNIKPGDRFMRPAAAYPGTSLDGYASWMGGFAEYGLVTDTQALLEDDPSATPNPYCQYQQRIPAGLEISPADATMLVTLKEIASSVRDVNVGFGAKVAVLGTGAVGMAMCFFAKLRGAYPVIAIGRRDQPLADCLRAGADFGVNGQKEDMVAKVMEHTGGAGVDFVLDAAGDITLVMESGKLLANNGAIASYASSSGSVPLTVDNIQGPSRWRFLKSGPDETSAHQYLLDLVRVGAVPLKNFFSHSIPLDDFDAGFMMLVEKRASKIVFMM